MIAMTNSATKEMIIGPSGNFGFPSGPFMPVAVRPEAAIHCFDNAPYQSAPKIHEAAAAAAIAGQLMFIGVLAFASDPAHLADELPFRVRDRLD